MVSKRSIEARGELQAAAVEADDILRGILRAEHHSDAELARQLTDSPLKPFIIASAKCILFVRLDKRACLLGITRGRGVLMTRLPTSHASLIKFSAPLFVEVKMVSGGLSLGHSVTSAFVACMDRQLQDGLLRTGRRPLVGLDAAFVCGSSLSSRADPLLLLGCASALEGTVAVSKASGGLFDISFAGGSMRVDAARNGLVYGAAKPAEVLSGAMEPPPEFQPLYAELSLIIHQVEQAPEPPSRASFSLERFSTGRDPDSVMVLPGGAVVEPEK